MAEDREILKEIWEGKIPVCFTLAPEDLSSLDQPSPIYMMVPRITYFPVVTEKVRNQFIGFTKATEKNEMWLEFEDEALKWHYPVGLLFDLYGHQDQLPWKIQVHFSNFPEDDLLRCPSKEAVESHLMSMVKEADALKHRGKVVNGMQARDHKQLWNGLQNDRQDQFWAINKKLMVSESVAAVSAGGEDTGGSTGSVSGFRYIPCRLYTTDRPYVQQLVKPSTEDGTPITFEDMITLLTPDIAKRDKYTFILHGVEVPLDTPASWLSEYMSYPDNFLHICAIPRVVS